MISVEKAKQIIFGHVGAGLTPPAHENVLLSESLGRITASPILSPISVPLFDNSAMDGFALRSSETLPGNVSLKIVGEIKAGDPPVELKEPNSCLRIMTGAPLPCGADAVVKKEEVKDDGKTIRLSRSILVGENVRQKGEDFQKGEIALPAGTRMTPGVLGILASIGIQKVETAPKPRVAIIVTGHELAVSLESLKPGQIIESNSVMLRAALKEMGINPVITDSVEDDPQKIGASLARALENSDIVIMTGGVSVGEHDLTRKVLNEMGVQEHFWKVNQKPGKPFCFGTTGKKMIFGLPGNPYAVFVCFYLYIRPALLVLMGDPRPELRRFKMKVASPLVKKDDRTHFLKGKIISKNGESWVLPLKGQGSHLLGALKEAETLIQIPAEKKEVGEGEETEVIWLP